MSSPAVSCRSFTPTGTPCNGASGSPARTAASAAAAATRARPKSVAVTALTAGFTCSILAMHASSSSIGESSFVPIRRRASTADSAHSSSKAVAMTVPPPRTCGMVPLRLPSQRGEMGCARPRCLPAPDPSRRRGRARCRSPRPRRVPRRMVCLHRERPRRARCSPATPRLPGEAAPLARRRRPAAGVLTAIAIRPGTDRRECETATTVAGLPGGTRPVPGFGSSDCRCRSHLVYF